MDTKTIHVQLNQARCKGCLLCTDVCPNDLLKAQPEAKTNGYFPVVMVDEAYCINCLRCVDVCPDRAFVLPQKKQLNWKGYAYWLGRKIEERIQEKTNGDPG